MHLLGKKCLCALTSPGEQSCGYLQSISGVCVVLQMPGWGSGELQTALPPAINFLQTVGNAPPSTTVQHWQKGSVVFPSVSAFDCHYLCYLCSNSAWIVPLNFNEIVEAVRCYWVCEWCGCTSEQSRLMQSLKNTWNWRFPCPDLGTGLSSSSVKILPHVLAKSILCFSFHMMFFT